MSRGREVLVAIGGFLLLCLFEAGLFYAYLEELVGLLLAILAAALLVVAGLHWRQRRAA